MHGLVTNKHIAITIPNSIYYYTEQFRNSHYTKEKIDVQLQLAVSSHYINQ